MLNHTRSPIGRRFGALSSLLVVILAQGCGSDGAKGGAGAGGAGAGGAGAGGAGAGGAGAGGAGAGGAGAGGAGAGALGAADGITGTINGTVHTFTMNPNHIPQMASYVLIGSWDALYPRWGIFFKPELGTQACTDAIDPANTVLIQYTTLGTNDTGSTGGAGDCTITVTSLTPKFEGSFSGTIVTGNGTFPLTDGHFRIAN